jgi:hypothetical protein
MTPGMRLRLLPLRPDDETEARLAHAELAVDGFTFLLSLDRSDSWEDYLALRRREVRGDERGGVLEDVVQPAEGETPVRRYWID